MFYTKLSTLDLDIYREDIFRCYQDNVLILDSQNILDLSTPDLLIDFLEPYATSRDSFLFGIFKDDRILGIVMFNNVRITEEISSAEVHLALSKKLRGKRGLKILEQIRDNCNIDNIYCIIPEIAINTINVCKKLGFKKTGYIPDNLPYVNAQHIEKMYDSFILTYRADQIGWVRKEIDNILKELEGCV